MLGCDFAASLFVAFPSDDGRLCGIGSVLQCPWIARREGQHRVGVAGHGTNAASGNCWLYALAFSVLDPYDETVDIDTFRKASTIVLVISISVSSG